MHAKENVSEIQFSGDSNNDWLIVPWHWTYHDHNDKERIEQIHVPCTVSHNIFTGSTAYFVVFPLSSKNKDVAMYSTGT